MPNQSYPRMLFRGDATCVVVSVDELVAQHAFGWCARPLPDDGPEEAACYDAPVSADDADAPSEDTPGDTPADAPKRRGRPRKLPE